MLRRASYGRAILSILAGVVLASGGCGEPTGAGDHKARPNRAAAREIGGPGLGPAGPSTSTIGTPSIKQIMGRLNKGDPSLTTIIGEELEVDSPDWQVIQPQAEEYAHLAAALRKNQPPKGSDESWSQLTAAFIADAQALRKAVQSKDPNSALDAHQKIADSCVGCHTEHRTMRPFMAGPPLGGPRRPAREAARARSAP